MQNGVQAKVTKPETKPCSPKCLTVTHNKQNLTCHGWQALPEAALALFDNCPNLPFRAGPVWQNMTVSSTAPLEVPEPSSALGAV